MEGRHGIHGDSAEVEEPAERVEAALLPPLLAVGAALDEDESRMTAGGVGVK